MQISQAILPFFLSYQDFLYLLLLTRRRQSCFQRQKWTARVLETLAEFSAVFKLKQFNLRIWQNNSQSVCIACIILLLDILENNTRIFGNFFILPEIRGLLHIHRDVLFTYWEHWINTMTFMKSCDDLFQHLFFNITWL